MRIYASECVIIADMPVKSRRNRLSPVEFRVLVCGILGCSVEYTAHVLGLADGTIHAHRRTIKFKRQIPDGLTYAQEWRLLQIQVEEGGFEPG